jgi:hypothetical protein
VPKPAGRNFRCPHCGQTGHRDLIAAASIAARAPGGGTIPSLSQEARITHRRAGRHLPGVHPARREPRRRSSSRPATRRHLAGTGPPLVSPTPEADADIRGVARVTREEHASLRHLVNDLRVGALWVHEVKSLGQASLRCRLHEETEFRCALSGLVGLAGLEPATSATQTRRASQTALQPVRGTV